MKYEKIYNHSPIFFQNFMCTMAGYQNDRSRYGDTYKFYMDYYEKYDKLSFDEKLELQRQELIKFINFAYNNSKFYHDLYKDIDLSKIKTVDDLKLLPIMTKDDLRERYDDIRTVDPKHAVTAGTSGTTGKSLTTHFTIDDRMQRMAQVDHCKRRSGFINLKMKRATFMAKHVVPVNQKKDIKVFWRYNAAVKQLLFSSYHITESNMKYYVDELNRFKPDAIDGIFSSIDEVANYIERHNLKLDFKPIAIFTTGETINEVGRERIERVFGCTLQDFYSSSEGAPIIFECKEKHKHIELMTGIFEHLDDTSNDLLVTSFTTHGAPLIRYKIGDSVPFDNLFVESDCPCGNNAPTVPSIEGRSLDYLLRPDNSKVFTGIISALLKNLPYVIVKAQYVQNRIDEVDGYFVVDKKLYNPEKHNKMLEEAFYGYFYRDETKFNINIVDDIPRAAGAKYRTVINNLVTPAHK